MPVHNEGRNKRHAQLHRKVEKRNFSLGVWNGIFYNFGVSFLSKTTVLPAFLSHLTASSGLIGFLGTFESVGWYLPQLPASAWIQHKHRKMPLYRAAAALRTLMFLALAIVALFSPPPGILLVASVAAMIIFYLGAGPGGIVFMDLYAKAISPSRRGRFLAIRMSIGGIISATVGAAIISYFLGSYPFPANFGFVFLCGTVICGFGFLFMALMREPRERVTSDERSVTEQVAYCMKILRTETRFRKYIVTRLFFECFTLGMPFLFLFGSKHLGFTTSDVGIFIAIECAGLVISNYFWARIADKRSNKQVLVATAYVALLVPILIIAYSIFDLPVFLYPVVFALSAAVDCGRTIGGMGYLVDIIPKHERVTYSALYNTLLAFPLMLAGFAGILLDAFGFVLVYGLLLVVSIVTLIELKKLDDIHAHERT
jgi:MFS family permease